MGTLDYSPLMERGKGIRLLDECDETPGVRHGSWESWIGDYYSYNKSSLSSFIYQRINHFHIA
jgi:hypothetical protein